MKHTYTLDGTKILRETWGGNTLIPLYDNEDSVCGILYNEVAYYFHKNLQGDVIAVVDKNAEVVARYSYDAWGVCTVAQDSTECGIAHINPYRYRGYYFDEEIGLYYLQSRYYDPSVGRFINADEVEFATVVDQAQLHNTFAYCVNNPITLIDNNGYFGIPWQIKVGLVAGVASAIWEMGKYISSNWRKKKFSWEYVQGLGSALARGFIRGFVVGLLSTIPGAWKYGLMGGALNLIFLIIDGKVKTVGDGISAFMDGWTKGVFTKALSRLFSMLFQGCKWTTDTKNLISFSTSMIIGYGISKYFKW